MKPVALVICGKEKQIQEVLAKLQELKEFKDVEPETLPVTGISSRSILMDLFSKEEERAIDEFIDRNCGSFVSIGICERA